MSGDFYGQTTVHPLGLAALLALSIFLLLAPRRLSLLPLIVLACMVPAAQRVVIAGFDFTFMRLLVIVGWLRVVLRNEAQNVRTTPLDFLVVAWGAMALLTYTIQQASVAAFVNRLGLLIDSVGLYFFVRTQLRDEDDVERIFDFVIALSFPVLMFFAIEKLTGRNLFYIFGGVPEFTAIREGRLRVQGAFAHPILAGCFWAAAAPFAWARYKVGTTNQMGAATSGAVIIAIVILTASSTPLIGLIAAGFALWLFARPRLIKVMLLSSVPAIVVLSFIMEAPVYHLIARIDLSGGSTGWHRFHLIHQTIQHFGEWWLVGIANFDHWQIWANDITNQYILMAIRGGLMTLGLFVATMFGGFKAASVVGLTAGAHSKSHVIAYALGASLFVHAVNFIGVSYFGQISMLLYVTLGALGSLEQMRVHTSEDRIADRTHHALSPGRLSRQE
jgi:hypothetical protein